MVVFSAVGGENRIKITFMKIINDLISISLTVNCKLLTVN